MLLAFFGRDVAFFRDTMNLFVRAPAAHISGKAPAKLPLPATPQPRRPGMVCMEAEEQAL